MWKFILGLAIVVLTSCSESTKETEAHAGSPPSGDTNIRALFRLLATSPQTHLLAGHRDTAIVCGQGTRMNIRAGAFFSGANLPFRDTVTLEVLELFSKKELILNNAIPSAAGQLRSLEGKVQVRARARGQILNINPQYTSFVLSSKNKPSKKAAALYSGSDFSLVAANLDWLSHSDDAVVTEQDSSGIGAFYLNSAAGAAATFKVHLSGPFNSSNTVVFLSMDGSMALSRLYPLQDHHSGTFSSGNHAVPSGLRYTVVALGFDGSHVYQALHPVTLSGAMELKLPPLTQSDKSQILALLSAL